MQNFGDLHLTKFILVGCLLFLRGTFFSACVYKPYKAKEIPVPTSYYQVCSSKMYSTTVKSTPISNLDLAEEKTAKELPPNLSKVTFRPHARLLFDSQSPRTSNERDARNVRRQRVAAIQPPLPRQYPASSLNPSSKASSSSFSSVRPSFLPFCSSRHTGLVATSDPSNRRAGLRNAKFLRGPYTRLRRYKVSHETS